ncbi:hypothetical protein QAD02_005578 [Eretmocerus hayati]|uniref:Uncharacterized protein n=1 Tax=Eretmocerus hayati TaxID=131215 RepID=A0ACC2NT45_9HYME|nr:hypothetical protein QAD02_005578 [Eretmocerus hayati]
MIENEPLHHISKTYLLLQYTYGWILRDSGISKSFLEVVDLTSKNLTGNPKDKVEEMKETYAELEIKVQNDMKGMRNKLRKDLDSAKKAGKKMFVDMKKRAKTDMQNKYDQSHKKIETAQMKFKEYFDFLMPELTAAAKLSSNSSPSKN